MLHRQINTSTDAHPNFKSSTKCLHANYGHYSGIILDIFYDHFLAKKWNDYSSQSLSEFADKNYRLFQKNFKRLTPQIQHMLPYMVQNNWLYNYQFINGISDTLDGMNRRTKGKSGMHQAMRELMAHYDAFESDFKLVFKDLMLVSKYFILEF